MMSKLIASIVTAAFMGVFAAPAIADCNADIAKVEPAIMKVSDATKKAKAEKDITEAKDAAKKKNEKQCVEYLAAAKKVAGIKSGASPLRHSADDDGDRLAGWNPTSKPSPAPIARRARQVPWISRLAWPPMLHSFGDTLTRLTRSRPVES
jgi:hypothetical protein